MDGKKRGARSGASRQDAPDHYRCQRVIVQRTGGMDNLWRCGARVRSLGGFCARHRNIADAAFAAPPPEWHAEDCALATNGEETP